MLYFWLSWSRFGVILGCQDGFKSGSKRPAKFPPAHLRPSTAPKTGPRCPKTPKMTSQDLPKCPERPPRRPEMTPIDSQDDEKSSSKIYLRNLSQKAIAEIYVRNSLQNLLQNLISQTHLKSLLHKSPRWWCDMMVQDNAAR